MSSPRKKSGKSHKPVNFLDALAHTTLGNNKSKKSKKSKSQTPDRKDPEVAPVGLFARNYEGEEPPPKEASVATSVVPAKAIFAKDYVTEAVGPFKSAPRPEGSKPRVSSNAIFAKEYVTRAVGPFKSAPTPDNLNPAGKHHEAGSHRHRHRHHHHRNHHHHRRQQASPEPENRDEPAAGAVLMTPAGGGDAAAPQNPGRDRQPADDDIMDNVIIVEEEAESD